MFSPETRVDPAAPDLGLFNPGWGSQQEGTETAKTRTQLTKYSNLVWHKRVSQKLRCSSISIVLSTNIYNKIIRTKILGNLSIYHTAKERNTHNIDFLPNLRWYFRSILILWNSSNLYRKIIIHGMDLNLSFYHFIISLIFGY